LTEDRARRIALLMPMYDQFEQDGDTAVFVARVHERYTLATLEKIAEFGSRGSRRAATHALGLIGDYSVNDQLGRRMSDADRGVRLLAERLIRDVWFREGSTEQRHQLQQLQRFNSEGRGHEAIQQASEMLEQAPQIAEIWNQRAVAHAIQHEPERSKQDGHQALELNPYHFSAAVNMGHCYLELKDRHGALDSFRRALKLNPNLDGVRARVLLLQRALEKE
jgi:tetratricopeptide (TPR) repeat protein